MPEYGLGRHFAPDDRDTNYRMSALLADEPLPRYRYWRAGRVLDQGSYPHCVGFSWRKFLEAAPMMTKTGPTPQHIYHEAQKIDEWPGEDYAGTSVRAGVKVLHRLGHIQEYRWAFSTDDIFRWVLTRGPVIVGTPWLRDMFYPDREGYIKPTGAHSGGHAYTLVGASRVRGAFRILNSWGRGWGQWGRAWIAGEDLAVLMSDWGEACTATEKRL